MAVVSSKLSCRYVVVVWVNLLVWTCICKLYRHYNLVTCR